MIRRPSDEELLVTVLEINPQHHGAIMELLQSWGITPGHPYVRDALPKTIIFVSVLAGTMMWIPGFTVGALRVPSVYWVSGVHSDLESALAC